MQSAVQEKYKVQREHTSGYLQKISFLYKKQKTLLVLKTIFSCI